MEAIREEIHKVFGHKLRLRVSGICLQEEGILLIKHVSLGPKGVLWAPPGGGLDYLETIEESLHREFLEETGLEIRIGEFLFVNEYFEHPLHAIELFFKVEVVGGALRQGTDPEMGEHNQIIKEVGFVSFEKIRSSDPDLFHSLFKKYTSPEQFQSFGGFLQNIVKRP